MSIKLGALISVEPRPGTTVINPITNSAFVGITIVSADVRILGLLDDGDLLLVSDDNSPTPTSPEDKVELLVKAAIDNEFGQQITQALAALNTQTTQSVQALDDFIAEARLTYDQHGDGSAGTTAINIASIKGGSPNVAGYLHVKLAMDATVDYRMFYLKLRGYAYFDSEVIDSTFVGYCNASSADVIYEDAQGTLNPLIYVGATDKAVYCRIGFLNSANTVVAVDAMKVASGDILTTSDVQLIFSVDQFLGA